MRASGFQPSPAARGPERPHRVKCRPADRCLPRRHDGGVVLSEHPSGVNSNGHSAHRLDHRSLRRFGPVVPRSVRAVDRGARPPRRRRRGFRVPRGNSRRRVPWSDRPPCADGETRHESGARVRLRPEAPPDPADREAGCGSCLHGEAGFVGHSRGQGRRRRAGRRPRHGARLCFHRRRGVAAKPRQELALFPLPARLRPLLGGGVPESRRPGRDAPSPDPSGRGARDRCRGLRCRPRRVPRGRRPGRSELPHDLATPGTRGSGSMRRPGRLSPGGMAPSPSGWQVGSRTDRTPCRRPKWPTGRAGAWSFSGGSRTSGRKSPGAPATSSRRIARGRRVRSSKPCPPGGRS